MLIKILLVISIIVQTLATLTPAAGTRHQVQLGVDSLHRGLLAALRRAVRAAADGRRALRAALVVRYLGIVVSVCLSIGVMYAHKLFKYIDRLNRQRQLLNKRILTAVLRTEEKARSRFSKELHDGLGPLLSSARMSLSALARDERSPEQKEIIDNTTYVIDEAIRSLREISNNLSPTCSMTSGWRGACRTSSTRAPRCTT